MSSSPTPQPDPSVATEGETALRDVTDVQPAVEIHPASRGWLYPLVFVAGASFMAFEIVGSRILAPFFGNSVFVWGALIGVFLSALSVGYIIGGRLSQRYPTPNALAVFLALGSVLTALVVVLADPIQEWVVTLDMAARLNPLVSSLIIFTPASVLIGMVSPYAVRLRARDVDSVGETAGTLYGLSTIGSIVGTLGAAFWLIPEFGTDQIIAWIALAVALCAAAAAGAGRHMGAIILAGLALLVAVVVVMGTSGTDETVNVRGEDWSPIFRDADFESAVTIQDDVVGLKEIESQYHDIIIAEQANATQGADALRLMKFDNSWQAGALVYDGKVDPIATPEEFRYINSLEMIHAYKPDIESILYIGLGSGAVAMRHRSINEDVKIDAIEIDPGVVDAAEEFFAFDGSTMDVVVGDGREELVNRDTKYDAIVVDAYFADTIPFHMTTREFMDVMIDHLNPDGIVAANIIGALEGQKSSLFRSMYRTYSDAFADVALHPIPLRTIGGEYDPVMTGHAEAKKFQNIELVASNSSLAGYSEAIERAEKLRADYPDVILDRTVEAAKNRYTASIPLGDVSVLTDDFAPVDSLALVSVYETE